MITLRAPEMADVDSIFLWENDPGFNESLPQSAPLSRYQVWEYIQNYKADPFSTRELRMIIFDEALDKAVGHIDMFDFDPVNRRAGIGIFIDESRRREGYAKEALEMFEAYVIRTLGMHQLWAYIALDNEASKGLFTKAGFKPAGRLRSWLRRKTVYQDALFFQKLFE